MSQKELEGLLFQAQKAIDSFEHSLAIKFLSRAFDLSSTSEIATQIGCCYLEVSSKDDSIKWFERALQIDENCFGAWLQLAQLSFDSKSVDYYEKAIQILIHLTQKENHNNEFYSKQISNAYCALAEIYLTDLWFLKFNQVK